MKKIMMIMTLALLICSTAMAQNERRGERRQWNPEEMVQRQTDRLASQLKLNDEQKAALLELNKKYQGKLMGQRGQRGQQPGAERKRPSREEMEAQRKQMEDNMKAYNEELTTILTPDQMKKYEKLQQEMRQRGPRGEGMHGQRGDWGGRGRGDRGGFDRNGGFDNNDSFGNNPDY